MKKMKKILATFMVVVMILTAAPLSGFVGLELPNWFNIFASAATYSGSCGDNLIWTLDADTGELIISGTGDMNDYDYRSPWYDYRYSITKVRIESGAANIGDYAFYGCQNLISVTIPTSIINIGYTAFDYCDKLSLVYYLGTTEEWNAINVETRNGDLTEKTDITFVLYEDDIVSHGTCGSDLSWTLHKSGDLEINGVGRMKDFDSSSVTPWYIFKSSIRNLTISEGIEGIGSYAFDGFTNINNISLPSSLEVIDEFSFRDCTGIINVFYEGNLTEYCDTFFSGYAANPIRYADNFYVDGILIEGELIIPEGVASIRHNAFYYCNKISKVVIPYSVKYIGSNAFEYCTNIEHVEILNGVVEIQGSAFYNCEKLSSVIIPNTITTIGSYTFNGCNELKTVYYDGTPIEWNNISIGDCNDPLTRTSEIVFTANEGDVFASGECGDNLTWTLYSSGELIISGTGKMESYYDHTYAPWNDYRSLIKKLIIREGVTSIGECAFESCVNLGEITIPESVTKIERNAFTDTAYYTDYNNWEYIYNESDYSSSMVLYIGDCLIIANADEWNVLGNYIVRDNTTVIADYAFENCSTLYNISIPDSVLNIGEGAFYNCINLEYVEFPSHISKIERYTFWCCESLSTFDFSRQLTHIGEGAFSGCGFYSINLPESLLYIGEGAFSGSKLRTISIPDSISVIEDGVFSHCENLNRINLPETLIKLGVNVFAETAYYNDASNWEDGVLYLDDCLLEVDPSYVGELVVKDGTRIIADEAAGGQFAGMPGNENITGVILPNGLETIGVNAFCKCSGISKISFPCSVKRIFEWAFYGTGIDLFVIPETVECVAWKTFSASQYKPTNVDFVGSEEAWEIVTANQTGSVSSNKYITINYNCEDTFEHNYSDWKVISNGSCVENGIEKRECEYCNKTEEKIIESKGHSWNSEYTIDMPATCTSNGYKSIHCSVCNGMKDGQIIPSIDHSFGDWICLKVATCTEKGLEKRECVSCGLVEENHIEVSGHNYIDVIIDPTCTANGYTVHTCSVCGDSYTDSETAAPGHDYYENVVPPTETEEGFTLNTCRNCDSSYISDIVPAIGINGTCGENLAWSFDKSTGELVITGTGDMDDYGYGEAPWYSYRNSIKNVIIESGVTSIGDYAFRSCENVASVVIPEGVRTIGNFAFDNCKVLKNVTTPDSLVDIGDHAFANSGLTNVSISEGVKSIDNNAFAGCCDLENISVDSQNTEYSSDENGVLFNKDKTTLILYPANNPRTDYTVPDSVTVISSYAFDAASNLTSVTINKGVTEIGTGAFNDCVNLETTYYKGNEHRWGTISISSLNDYLTRNVVFLIEGKDVVDSGSCGENLVWNMYDNGKLIITGTGDMDDFDVGGTPWKSYSSTIKSVIIENGVTSIGTYAFFGYKSVTSVTIGDSVTSIGNYAFEWCASLTSITIGNGVTYIGDHAFGYCTSLNSVTIPNSVTTIGNNVFYGCTGLTSVLIGNGVITIGDGVFSDCTNLTSVTIGNSVTSIGNNVFYGCTGLTSITIPDNVITIGKNAFRGCTGLTSITIPDSITAISESMFYGCTGLTNVTIPDSVTTIGGSAFESCTDLTSVTIPDGVTVISYYAFKSCTGLTSITIPNSVTSIGYYALNNCTGLTDIYYGGNKHQWLCTSGLMNIGFDLSKVTVHFADSDSFDDHTFVVINTVAATCLEEGLNEYACKCGESYSEAIPATGHTYTDVVIDPTCTSNGYIVHTCSACGDSYTDSEILASGHDYYQNVIVPSCTDGGYTINVCRHCNDVYISDMKQATGHSYTTVVINPTCVNEGYTLGACTVCGASSITDKKPALGHEYFEQVTPATCETEGYTTYTCTRGDHIYIDNKVAAFGHDYEKTVFAPTCIQDGCTFNICNTCGRMHKSDVVSAQGHSFGSWRTIIEPSANKEGLEERYCKYCGYTEERLLPMTQRTSYTATFMADGKVVATIEFLKGTTSIAEPPVPHKDRYSGQWESYTLANADIVINAVYQPVILNNISGVSNNKTAEYNSSTGVATVTLTASSDAKTVITQSKESVPLDIVLVVDQSGSMNSNLGGRYSKKDSLIDSTTEFVNMVYDDAKLNGVDHRVAIVGFGMGSKSSGFEYPAYLNTEILTTGGRPLSYQYATKQDYQNALMSVNQNGSLNSKITTAINSIDANGATAADYGLSMASSVFANNPIDENENRQRIVIFISDGEPTHSNSFEVDVANAAIQQAHQLKNTHNATVYSVGVMTDSEAKSEKLNAFLARISSDYMDARNIFGNANRVSETYSINVDDTDNLSGMFSEIVTENMTQTTDFDNVTIIDTVSKYFTLTSQQEKDLRYSVINEYGVKNSDIDISRNDDGTTSIVIRNIQTKPVEVDGKIRYSVTISYEVSANENAAITGAYPVCTDDSGIIMDGNECYEKTYAVPVIEVPENRNTVVFKVNGEVYEIKSATPGSMVSAPQTDFIGEYEFSGWDIPETFVSEEVLSEFDSVLIRPEYVIIWNTENGAERVTYSPGDVITVPDVSPKSNGESFRRWNGTVPVLMPAESLEFTAVYGDHVHQYYAQTVKAVTCLEDGITKYVCEGCNDSYTEMVASPGEHSWKAIANPGNKENSSTAYFECQSCGICADKFLNYIVTENEANERGHHSSITYEYDYMDEDGACYQPDGDITIVSTVSDYFDGADEIKVYRIDENGNKVQCTSEYDNGVLTFDTNHFSTYIFEPVYSCQSTGDHSDENDDGYCDRCDGVLKDFIDFIVKEGIDAQIDSEFRLLLGNDVLNYSVEEINNLFEFGNIFVKDKETGRIGTGDIVCLTNDNGEVCSQLTVVIFGDVNGDGWYDGTDSIIVSCLANGLLTQDSVSEAVYMAADCNHDGTIDSFDVALLEQAGLLLANVDQSKSHEELATDGVYIEYLDLIDQTPEAEDESGDNDADVEIPDESEKVESEDTTQSFDYMTVIADIFDFIKKLISVIFSFIIG